MDFEAPRKRQMQQYDSSEKLFDLDMVRRKLDFDAESLIDLPSTTIDEPLKSRNLFMNLLDSNAVLPKF